MAKIELYEEVKTRVYTVGDCEELGGEWRLDVVDGICLISGYLYSTEYPNIKVLVAEVSNDNVDAIPYYPDFGMDYELEKEWWDKENEKSDRQYDRNRAAVLEDVERFWEQYKSEYLMAVNAYRNAKRDMVRYMAMARELDGVK